MTLASVESTYGLLAEKHYLGPTKAARFAWSDEHGAMVFAAPRSRRLPTDWLELVRWCLDGTPNAGSRQWAAFAKWARQCLAVTTIVSYSDPGEGHTGALYRACNWLWAPTWHCLRPPPSGNGEWTAGKRQSVKHRWIYPLLEDDRRGKVLAVQDNSLQRKYPWAQYREPEWRAGRFDPAQAGGDFKRWQFGHRPD